MKIKTISRTPFTKQTKFDIDPIQRNYSPKLHPFQQQREYVRALNSTKLENTFSAPFVAAMDMHSDTIWKIALSKFNLRCFLSGACDGNVIVWDLSTRTPLSIRQAHSSFITGLSVVKSSFITCSKDKTIKHWDLKFGSSTSSQNPVPLQTIKAQYSFNHLSLHSNSSQYATCSGVVDIWDVQRTTPLYSFEWGADNIYTVNYNPVETHVLASTSSDRGILLYDLRARQPIHKTILKMKSNDLSWNPQEPFNFTVANDDGNLYTFDMRKMTSAKVVHKDHTDAVLSVDYSPTGLEFVSGSYDRTIRIFERDIGKSREVYFTKRMQRVFCTKYTLDSKYILSGSDDTNIRIWKSKRSDSIGSLHPAQKQNRRYQKALVDKWQHMPEVRRINRHRRVPKHIYSARTKQRIHQESQNRKEQNRRAHSTKGMVPYVSIRKKPVVDSDADG